MSLTAGECSLIKGIAGNATAAVIVVVMLITDGPPAAAIAAAVAAGAAGLGSYVGVRNRA